MTISQAREKVLLDYIASNPSGAKNLARLAIASVPYKYLKQFSEDLGLEAECVKVKKAR